MYFLSDKKKGIDLADAFSIRKHKVSPQAGSACQG
jgi:hypothetical protein